MKPSFDPRVKRLELPSMESLYEEGELYQWQTYEVFQQQARGDRHMHVGSLHAPNPEMALVLAKEQYGRREQCVNLWVVKTSNVHATRYEDSDMFLHATNKIYREGAGYKVKGTIEEFKHNLDGYLAGSEGNEQKKEVEVVDAPKIANLDRVIRLSAGKNGKPRMILIRKI